MRFYACCIETRDVKRVRMALKRPRRVITSMKSLNFHLKKVFEARVIFVLHE